MSRDLNKVMIIGRLGRAPEMKYTSSGHTRTKFSVATSRSWTTQGGEKRSETEWFNVVTWDRLAEICNQYLEKGHKVYIEGRLQTRHWNDSDGNKRSIVEVVANEMLMLSSKRDLKNETLSSELGDQSIDHLVSNTTDSSGNDSSFEDDFDDEFPF